MFVAIRIGTDPVQSYLQAQPAGAARRRSSSTERVNGLTGNIVSQYFHWLAHFVTFNWGRSIKGSRPVWPELKDAMANTFVLGGLATIVGIVDRPRHRHPLGAAPPLAVRPDLDHRRFVGISIPPYVTAVLLQLFFAITLTRWLGL